MSKTIKLRNVPDRLHQELVTRAKARGLTLSEFIEEILEREVGRPPLHEVYERIRSSEPVDLGRPAADLIRDERQEAGREP
jgi:antitoxin FitA